MSTLRRAVAEKAYHHGSLRQALIEAGLTVLSEGGNPAGLSLREAARRAGVSAMAPYRHFSDKEALLAAIAGVGFARLTRRLTEADAGAEGSRALVAQGEAYVAFALAEPALFRLMFGAALAKVAEGAETPREGETAYAVMATRVAMLVPPERRDIVALHCWALAHGLASLALDGRLAAGSMPLDQLVRAVLDVSAPT